MTFPIALSGTRISIGALVGSQVTQLPQLGSLVARWSADSITPVADGTPIGTWTDSIGGYAATQATGGLKPLYKTNVIGTKPSLLFNGSFMDAGRPAPVAAAMDSAERTLFVVFKTNGNTSTGMLINTSPAGGGNYMLVADGTNTGSYNFTLPHTSNVFSTVGSTKTAEAGGMRVSINGGQAGIADSDSTNSGGVNMFFGGIQNSTFFCNAHIFDILIWNRALTAWEMLVVQKWACDKYGQPYPWTAYSDFHVYAGDSLTQGSGAYGPGSYPYQAAALMSRPYGTWTNTGQGGTTMAQVDAACAKHVDAIPATTGKLTKMAVFEYYNQRLSGAAACEAASTTMLANRALVNNLKVVFATSTSAATDPDATRTAYNTYFDANHTTNIAAYVPMHTDTSIGISTAYTTNSATLWFDTVHLNAAGNAILAGLIKNGITSF